MMKPEVCLIIPCYNEAGRLDLQAFRNYAGNIVFVFVDDGSSDGTWELLRQYSSQNIIIRHLEKNSGKAEAVRQGMLYAESNPDLKHIEWFGFWDADLATPLGDLENFISYRNMFYKDAEAVFGSRIKRLGGSIIRNEFRHLVGRLFATIFKILFNIDSYDSQCGSKIFRRSCIKQAFAEKFSSRWIFDVEIILRLKGVSIVEYPLREWHDAGASKLMNFKNFMIVISDLFRLWRLHSSH